MNALSPWLYLRRNPVAVLSTGLFAAVMVFLCVTALTIIAGFRSSARRPLEQLRHFSLVVFEGERDTVERQRRQITREASVERLLEARVLPMRLETLFSQLLLPVLALPTDAHRSLVARVGNRLAAGRLPRRMEPEVALHERLIAANGLRIGATTDRGFRVVGVLSGPTPMGVIPLEFLLRDPQAPGHELEPYFLALPRPGRRAEMNRSLGRLAGVTVESHEHAVAQLDRNTRGAVALLDAIALLLFLLAAVITAIVYQYFFVDREDELAVLLAVGVSPGALVLRSVLETAVIGALSWLVGLAGGLAALTGLQQWVFGPRGLDFPVVAAGPLWLSAALPVSALLVTLLVIRGGFRQLDPVAILDRQR